jgi:hypothetical protein
VRYRRVEVGPGSHAEPFYHPLADAEGPEDIQDHAWPDADDFDYSLITQAAEASDGHWPIHAGRFEPFLIYCRMRGTEQAIEDLSLRPAIADAVLGRLGDFYQDHQRRIFEARGASTSPLADDPASTGLRSAWPSTAASSCPARSGWPTWPAAIGSTSSITPTARCASSSPT